MKLKELMEGFISKDNMSAILGPNQLKHMMTSLLQCDEFENVTSIQIVETPNFIDKENKPVASRSIKIGDNKFKGHMYLYSLVFTPEVYDPVSILNTDINSPDVAISPLIFDPKSFIPYKFVILRWNPELKQYLELKYSNKEKIFIQQMHEHLDKALNNPEKYKIKGTRGIILRGVFNY